MGEKYCIYCTQPYGTDPSLYELLYHTTEYHGDKANKLFEQVVTPHICAGCLNQFKAGLEYRQGTKTFLLEAYCPDCREENALNQVFYDEVSRSAVLHLRDDLELDNDQEEDA